MLPGCAGRMSFLTYLQNPLSDWVEYGPWCWLSHWVLAIHKAHSECVKARQSAQLVCGSRPWPRCQTHSRHAEGESWQKPHTGSVSTCLCESVICVCVYMCAFHMTDCASAHMAALGCMCPYTMLPGVFISIRAKALVVICLFAIKCACLCVAWQICERIHVKNTEERPRIYSKCPLPKADI